MSYVLKYPLKIGASGRFETDRTAASEIRAYLDCPPGGKLGEPEYGNPIYDAEQEPNTESLQSAVSVIQLHEGLETNVENAQFLAVEKQRSETDPENENATEVVIIWADRRELKEEPYTTKLGIGVDGD